MHVSKLMDSVQVKRLQVPSRGNEAVAIIEWVYLHMTV